MVILGLDPGTATTGYGIIKRERDNLVCVNFGCIKTMPHIEPAKRLQQIRAELLGVIKKYKPDASAIEQIFFTTNAKTAMSVAQARGVIL